MPIELRAGDLVCVRELRWRIDGREPYAGCALLRLTGIDEANLGAAAVLLEPFDRPVPIAVDTNPRVVGRRLWGRVLAELVEDSAPYDGLRAAARADVTLLPYQMEPALAVVAGLASRVLLADEVGLGKTIEAGLILAELKARGLAGHVLVVTPAGLRDQWSRELASRFGVAAHVVDAAGLGRLVRSLPAGSSPWQLPGTFIASFDFIKQPEVLRALEAVVWDLVIADEAHAAAGDSARHEAVQRLALRSRRVVLATATPHGGDDRSFAALTALGDHGRPFENETGLTGDRGSLVIFRRSRSDVGLRVDRRVKRLHVRPTPAERRMHAWLDRYADLVWRAHPTGPLDRIDGARLAMVVLKKRALSSAASLARSVARRLALLEDPPDVARQISLPLAPDGDEEQDDRDAEPMHELAHPGLEDGETERAWLCSIEAAARDAAHGESKPAALARLLARTGEPVIVFTEYRDTQDTISAVLGRTLDAPVESLHGGLTRAERAAVERAFVSGSTRVLVATDAAGEGLNLHARCRWVINCELPWTPTRLEQRIGRVDRLGQDRRVHALHLVADGTAETRILARLSDRLDRIRATVGLDAEPVGRLPEAAVAGLVFEGTKKAIDRLWPRRPGRRAGPPDWPTVRRVDLGPRAQVELERLMPARRLLRATGRRTRGGPGRGAGARLAGAERPRRDSEEEPPAGARALAALDRRQPVVAAVRRTRLGRVDSSLRPGGTILIFRVRLEDGAARPVERLIVPVHVLTSSGEACRDRRRLREHVRSIRAALAERGAIDDIVRHGTSRIAAIAGALSVAARLGRHREESIRRLYEVIAESPVQASLFDRRAIDDHDRRAALARGVLERSDRELARLAQASALRIGGVDLVLAVVCR